MKTQEGEASSRTTVITVMSATEKLGHCSQTMARVTEKGGKKP